MKPRRPQRSNYSDLTRLSSLIAQRRVDYEFLEKGGRIIYAVDSDIIKLFSNPKEESVDRGSRIGYCQFFKDSNKENAKNVAVALSHYLFYSVAKGLPLLVFDAQLREINAICRGLMRDAGKSQIIHNRRVDSTTSFATDNLEEILTLVKNIDNKRSDSISNEKQLICRFDNVSKKIIKGLEFGKELQRINQLLQNDTPRFAGVSFLLKRYPELLREGYFRRSNDIFSASIIRVALDRQLKKIAPSQTVDLRTNDVSSLYNLYFINKNLLESDDSVRLVLISGDDKIGQASAVLTTAIQESIGNNYSGSFSDLYIRHPLSFINDNKFIGDLDYENVKEKFHSLCHADDDQKIEYKRVQEVREFDDVASLFEVLPLEVVPKLSSEEFENRTEELPTIFDNFLESRLINYSLELEEYDNGKIDKLLKQIRETSSGDETLRGLYNQANNMLVKETNRLSFSLQQETLASIESKKGFCFRIPPFLRFGKVTAAERYVKSWVYHEENGEDAKALYEEVQKHDPSDYSATLCNSAIWAYLDDWNLVQENAGRAFKIAIDLIDYGKSNEPNLYVGHEAAYLSVVAARHLAKADKQEEVATLIVHLRLVIGFTKGLWNKFRIENKLEELESADEEYRFRHESLSVDLMEIWYDVFYFGIEEKPNHEIENLIEALADVKQQLLEIIQKTEDEIKGQKNGNRLDYLRYAQRHAINNYCLVFMVLDKHKILNSICQYSDIEGVLYIYNIAGETNVKKRFKAKSYLHACTMAASNLLYLDIAKKQKNEVRSQLSCLLTDENIAEFSRKPYERQRYLFYREILGI